MSYISFDKKRHSINILLRMFSLSRAPEKYTFKTSSVGQKYGTNKIFTKYLVIPLYFFSTIGISIDEMNQI